VTRATPAAAIAPDVDPGVLRELVAVTTAHLQRTWPPASA
jgi:hypothetical protein